MPWRRRFRSRPETRAARAGKRATDAANPARGARDKNGVRHRSALPASHRQHDPEARLAAHHAVVGLGGPFQRVHLVHRTDAGLDAERQRVLRVDGRAGVPALDGPAAPDEQERGDLQSTRRPRGPSAGRAAPARPRWRSSPGRASRWRGRPWRRPASPARRRGRRPGCRCSAPRRAAGRAAPCPYPGRSRRCGSPSSPRTGRPGGRARRGRGPRRGRPAGRRCCAAR